MKKQKFKVARAVHANQGLRARYQKQMLSLIDEMHNSVLYWISAQFKATPPAILADDASPSDEMRKKLQRIARRWIKRFNESAPKIAEAYLEGSFKTTDSAMRSALNDAGWTVKFKMTPQVRDAFQASLTENIGLIRSIPERYLQQVEGAVMRSYTTGRDLSTMTKNIKKLYPAVKDRAVLIARDQSNKANASVIQARQTQLGIRKAIWMHSHAGKVPRPSHVAADGREYDVSSGCLIDGEFILPGQLINCRCTSRSVLPIPAELAKLNS